MEFRTGNAVVASFRRYRRTGNRRQRGTVGDLRCQRMYFYHNITQSYHMAELELGHHDSNLGQFESRISLPDPISCRPSVESMAYTYGFERSTIPADSRYHSVMQEVCYQHFVACECFACSAVPINVTISSKTKKTNSG